MLLMPLVPPRPADESDGQLPGYEGCTGTGGLVLKWSQAGAGLGKAKESLIQRSEWSL